MYKAIFRLETKNIEIEKFVLGILAKLTFLSFPILEDGLVALLKLKDVFVFAGMDAFLSELAKNTICISSRLLDFLLLHKTKSKKKDLNSIFLKFTVKLFWIFSFDIF